MSKSYNKHFPHEYADDYVSIPIKQQNPRSVYVTVIKRMLTAIAIATALIIGTKMPPIFAVATDDDLQQVTQIFTRGSTNCLTNYAIDVDNYMQTQSLWQNTTNYVAYNAKYLTAKTSGGVVVSQQFVSTGEKIVYVWFTDRSDSFMTWGGGGITYNHTGGGANDLYQVTIRSQFASQGSGTCDGRVTGSQRIANATISTDPATASQGSDIKNYYATLRIAYNYPLGYTGLEFRSNYLIQNTYSPDIRYTVDVTNLQAVYTGNIPHAGRANILWSIAQLVNNQVVSKDTKTVDKNGTYTYTLQEYGTYEISATYLGIDNDINPAFTILQTRATFVADGTSYTQQSTDLNCTGGVCTQKSVYEDCSAFGTNVVGGFGCVMRNFGTFLKSILIAIFIPQSTKIADLLTQTVTLAQSHLGFLIYPIQWLTDMFGNFSNTSNNWCNNSTCTISGGQLFGANFNLDLLSARTNVPTLYNYGIIVIRGMTVAGLILMLRGKYLAVTKK